VELADYEGLPRDYGKELHDIMYHTHICECVSFVVVHFRKRDSFRLAQVYRYKLQRLHTPYFIDAWEDDDHEGARELAFVHLDKHAKDMKKCAVWRLDPLPLPEDFDITSLQASSNSTAKIRWSTTHAKSCMFEANDDDIVDDDSDGEDFDGDDVLTDDDDNELYRWYRSPVHFFTSTFHACLL
jgi:hypothetical protein